MRGSERSMKPVLSRVLLKLAQENLRAHLAAAPTKPVDGAERDTGFGAQKMLRQYSFDRERDASQASLVAAPTAPAFTRTQIFTFIHFCASDDVMPPLKQQRLFLLRTGFDGAADGQLRQSPEAEGSKSSGTLNLSEPKTLKSFRSDDAMTMDQVLAGYATDGERLWAAGALRNIPGKHEGEEDTVHGRRHSFVEQLQHAVREVVNLRRVSVTSGSTQPASPKTAAPTTAGKSKPHAAKKQAAAKIDFDLAELLKDPDKQAMLDRFCVTDGPGGFTQAETERMKAAFQRFKPEGGTEIDAIDDLEKILIHLGYLKVLPDVITRLVAGITQYATLDHTEYLRFMSSYAQYERDEVRKVFEQYDEDRSGSLTTEELEEVLKSFGVTPFRATIAYAISIVDEDESGTIDFKEFIHLLTVYRQTEGFTKNEVTKLYYVFDKFANPPKGVSLYKEIPADMLRESLMHMSAP
ncbi:unnamed protein product [Polarella glacialis]|uniref:Calmodulin n=1 Tax=Polarella glacialis TaxID=89957 RepID=A0A813GUG3_POLGL|nr:unnamed protein product [Polarella glacialis]